MNEDNGYTSDKDCVSRQRGSVSRPLTQRPLRAASLPSLGPLVLLMAPKHKGTGCARSATASQSHRSLFTYPMELAAESELPPPPQSAPPPPRLWAQTASATPHQMAASMAKSQHSAAAAATKKKTAPLRLDHSVWRPQTVPSAHCRTTVSLQRASTREHTDRNYDNRTADRLMKEWEPSVRANWRRLGQLQDMATEARNKDREEARAQMAVSAAAAMVAEAKQRVQEERARNQTLRAAALQRHPPPSEEALDAWMAREETRLSELEYLARLRAQKLLSEADVGSWESRWPLVERRKRRMQRADNSHPFPKIRA